MNRDIDNIRDADERLISAVLADRGNGEQTPEEWDEVDASWSRVEARLAALEQAATRVVTEYHKWSEDTNDGEFALYREDGTIMAIIALRQVLAASRPDRSKT